MLACVLFAAPFLALAIVWLVVETKAQVKLAQIEAKRGLGRGSRVYPEGVTLTVVRKGRDHG